MPISAGSELRSLTVPAGARRDDAVAALPRERPSGIEELAPAPASERPGDPEASALDRTRLRGRVINAIERIWGREAKRGDLLQPDAYHRLLQARGIGARSIREVERAVVAWGFDGIGGRDAPAAGARKESARRGQLASVLREVGPKQMLSVLAELCDERAASCRQRVTRRASRLRRARDHRTMLYYAMCAEYFRRCASCAPETPEG